MQLQGVTRDGRKWVHLQSVGKVEAKPAQEFEVGEYMMWNFGNVSKIISILKETKSFITFEVLCPDCWGDWAEAKTYERKTKKEKLVAIATLEYVKAATKNHQAD